MALPSNVPASLKELALLADEIWYLAGDTAVDSSWYTKRGSVAAVYAAAELFMTTDPDVQKTCGTGPTESTLVTGRDGANTAAAGERKDDGGGNEHHRVPDNEFAETRRFLQSRLAEVQDVGAAVGSVAQWLGFTAQSGVNVLRSKGFRI